MAQNVTIAGNQYPNVPSVLIPKTGGGGNAIFADPSVVTAVAADVASGKYFLDSSGVLTQGTASGGGGASNLVTGTFTGTTTGAAKDLTINYSGNGYPIALIIHPTGGRGGNTTFSALVQRYAIGEYALTKNYTEIAPLYTGTIAGGYDSACVMANYKSSSSASTSYARSGTDSIGAYKSESASASVVNAVKITSKNAMSVFIAGTSYGFAANIEYTYYVIYSS